MDSKPSSLLRWLFDPEHGASDSLIPRWIFLRALGLIYFSAFFSLLFQIRGLIGPAGILPAKEYLLAVANTAGHARYWYAPTLLWFSTSSHLLMGLCWAGLIASVLLTLNIWPRGMLAICWVCFLSFVGAAAEFSGYQSDGMLLEAGFISLFFAPPGWRPGLGRSSPPIRASLYLLRWEWFRIYFESGVAKIVSGDPQWRHFTAMDEYYQNGPLPTWIGWYVQHFPHWFHAASAFGTLALELALAWMLFLPRRWRIVCFFIVTPWQVGIILTANYTFLNYLVLMLGFLLLDDRFLMQFMPRRWKERLRKAQRSESVVAGAAPFDSSALLQPGNAPTASESLAKTNDKREWRTLLRGQLGILKMAFNRGDIRMALLRLDSANDLDDLAGISSANDTSSRTGTVSHCRPLRIVRGDDARALRNRVSRLGGRTELGSVPVSLQAAGSEQGTGHLRSISAALRLESVVRVAGRLAF